MCDGFREPPRPGTELYTYWRERPVPRAGEEHDLPLGPWVLRVRILRVKNSQHIPHARHVTMLVIG